LGTFLDYGGDPRVVLGDAWRALLEDVLDIRSNALTPERRESRALPR